MSEQHIYDGDPNAMEIADGDTGEMDTLNGDTVGEDILTGDPKTGTEIVDGVPEDPA